MLRRAQGLKAVVLKPSPYSGKKPARESSEAQRLLERAAFFTTVAEPAQLPPSAGEVAFVGRSNAGKSSAINALTRQRLAFTAKMPGRTQHLNFFTLGDERYLVDLPGYGYAAVAARERERWQALAGGYLERRAELRGVVLVMDARHPFTALDRELAAWLRPELPLHILLSKADKLTFSQGKTILREVEAELMRVHPAASSFQLFSSLRKTGIVEAAEAVARWFSAAGGHAIGA